MRRRINSTGRRKIPRSQIAIRVHSDDRSQGGRFEITLRDLASLGLPGHARVYVEPYAGNSSMRFALGTIDHPRMPPEAVLSEIDQGKPVLFRIKVVDEIYEVGRLLASANRVPPLDEEFDAAGRKSLLPLRPKDLGERLWRVVFAPGPRLEVSNRVPGLADRVVSDPLVQGLILPAAVGEVLEHLIRSPDDEEEWQADWRLFVDATMGAPVEWDSELDPDATDDLVQEVVDRFALLQRYTSSAFAAIVEVSE